MTATQTIKKTKEQRDQERLLKNKEKAEAHAKKAKDKADAIGRLQALVHKVPAAYSTWGGDPNPRMVGGG